VLVFALIAITNLCVGFALAIWLGQGPRPWYALFLPGKKTTGLIEIAALADSDPAPKSQQIDEEEPVVVSLMEISTEDLAKKTPPPKPRPIVETADEEEEETFATDLSAVLETGPTPADPVIDEEAVESMSFDELLDKTKPTPTNEADSESEPEEALTGGDIDALFSQAGKA